LSEEEMNDIEAVDEINHSIISQSKAECPFSVTISVRAEVTFSANV
jgi:hypothetical protein